MASRLKFSSLAFATFILAVGLMAGCSTPEGGVFVGDKVRQIRKVPAKPVSKKPLNAHVEMDLQTKINIETLEYFNFYGKFFNDRVQFFSLYDPNIIVHNATVKKLTLYFIDSTLLRKQYHVDRDISTRLINRHGRFKFYPKDSLSKVAAKSDWLIRESERGAYTLAENLRNYQLRWTDHERVIEFKSIYSPTDSTFQYEYIEELINYRSYYKIIERAYW